MLAGEHMKPADRRTFLKIAGSSLGIGVLYSAFPAARSHGEAEELFSALGRTSGEKVSPFSIVQLSDTHVGFNGPPDPLGTKAFERAVDTINALDPLPDLVLFTGDLTHDSEDASEHAARMKRFKEIASRLRVKKRFHVPGEHDSALDGGTLFKEHFGESHYAFDHKGVHFVGLDNVSSGKPMVGKEQIAWLQRDVARFSKTTPIV